MNTVDLGSRSTSRSLLFLQRSWASAFPANPDSRSQLTDAFRRLFFFTYRRKAIRSRVHGNLDRKPAHPVHLVLSADSATVQDHVRGQSVPVRFRACPAPLRTTPFSRGCTDTAPPVRICFTCCFARLPTLVPPARLPTGRRTCHSDRRHPPHHRGGRRLDRRHLLRSCSVLLWTVV